MPPDRLDYRASQPDCSSPAPPRRVAAVLERVARADARYLREHPDANSYVREYTPGECWPAEPVRAFRRVRVVRLEYGRRLRIFLCSGDGEP